MLIWNFGNAAVFLKLIVWRDQTVNVTSQWSYLKIIVNFMNCSPSWAHVLCVCVFIQALNALQQTTALFELNLAYSRPAFSALDSCSCKSRTEWLTGVFTSLIVSYTHGMLVSSVWRFSGWRRWWCVLPHCCIHAFFLVCFSEVWYESDFYIENCTPFCLFSHI